MRYYNYFNEDQSESLNSTGHELRVRLNWSFKTLYYTVYYSMMRLSRLTDKEDNSYSFVKLFGKFILRNL